MKFWLVILLVLSCGCFLHSQEFGGVSIVKIGDVEVIQSYESYSNTNKIESVKSSKIALSKIQKNQIKKSLKINNKNALLDSGKDNLEKPKTQKFIYKKLNNSSVFSTCSGKNITAVFSTTPNSNLKKDFNSYHNLLVTLFKEHLIKKNTYYYLFSQDTGKLYQYFNKPPPSLS